jgi:hypothetical protein
MGAIEGNDQSERLSFPNLDFSRFTLNRFPARSRDRSENPAAGRESLVRRQQPLQKLACFCRARISFDDRELSSRPISLPSGSRCRCALLHAARAARRRIHGRRNAVHLARLRQARPALTGWGQVAWQARRERRVGEANNDTSIPNVATTKVRVPVADDRLPIRRTDGTRVFRIG